MINNYEVDGRYLRSIEYPRVFLVIVTHQMLGFISKVVIHFLSFELILLIKKKCHRNMCHMNMS